MKTLLFSSLVLLVIGGCIVTKNRPTITASKADVLNVINRVNDYWQSNHSAKQKPSWDWAAYQVGNMAAYEVTKDEKYRDYAREWAEHNNWMGATSENKKDWKYSYGTSPAYVLFGDWEACFQVYIDLYHLHPEDKKVARAKEVMGYQISTSSNDYLWWSDGLFMVMPLMVQMYHLTDNKLYLQKLYDYFHYADSVMYDPEEGLYYRDARYIYPKHKTVNGEKDFWSRGNGWVFAAFAKVLEDLPEDNPHRILYISRFKSMAKALKQTQQPEGYWCRSLLDSAFAPGAETSGTAFFEYGMLWGINNGLLSKKEYLPVIKKGWNYLINVAMQKDGKIGYIQPIGDRAIPGQVIDKESTANFGVGGFLLAASEMYKLLNK